MRLIRCTGQLQPALSGEMMLNEMPQVLKRTNREHEWTGLSADIYDTFGGALEVVPSSAHHISMHLGRPVHAHCRCDGRWHRRIQSVGDIDVVPMGYPVRWEDDGPTRVLSLLLQPSLLREAAAQMGVGVERIGLDPQMQLRDPRLQYVCWAIVAELEEGDPANRLYGDSLALALAAHLVRQYGTSVPPKVPPGLSPRQRQLVLDYINENLDRNLSMQELAGVIGLSPSHFKTLFKSTTGVPVHQYVIRTRLDAAVKLLSKGEPANHVATHVGFVDQSHMARWMRRVHGVTPRDIQR